MSRRGALLLAGLLLAACAAPQEAPVKTLRAPRSGLTHPILDIDPDYEFREYRPFRHKVEALIEEAKKKGDITDASVYFRDLDNGPVIGIRDSAPFRPASLLKLPIMVAYLKARETDPGVLRRRLTYHPRPRPRVAVPYYAPSVTLKPGEGYSIDELLTAMISRSDNAAVHTLLPDMTVADYRKVHADLGLPRPNTNDADDPVSVRAYASFFRILYNASYLSREMSERALRYLAASEFPHGLRAGVPAGTTVAHKFGEHYGQDVRQLHDCGIVYHPRSPYVLCVMTKGGDFAKMAGVIADVSRLVYGRVDAAR